MGTTYAMLFVVSLVLAWLIYPGAVVESWTPSLGRSPTAGHYLALSGFVAVLGLIIGALGASFEPRGYFRHVALVDEET